MYRYIDDTGHEQIARDVHVFATAIRTGAVRPDTMVFSAELGLWRAASTLDAFALSSAPAERVPVDPATDQSKDQTAATHGPCPTCGGRGGPTGTIVSPPGHDAWSVVGAGWHEDRTFTAAELARMVLDGQLSAETRAMRPGMVNPVPIVEHPAFACLLGRPAKPRGPAPATSAPETTWATTLEPATSTPVAVVATPSSSSPRTAPAPRAEPPTLWGPMAQLLPRATRRAYLFWTVVGASFAFAADLVESAGAIVVFSLISMGAVVAILIAGVGRLHDLGQSGWWMLLAGVPFLNLGLALYLLFASDPGPNRFGPDPRQIG
jgi:uncharacterized membrane protein YhaH (DUF805 family)